MFSKVTVYLGSAAGNSPVYADNAAELGRRLAQAGVEIVYGGASVGTMWTMASAAIHAGGRVTGVFPKNFKGKKESQDRRIEVRAQGLAEMVETPDLASRVAKMTELSQACIVLPGSYGTMHELFARQAGVHPQYRRLLRLLARAFRGDGFPRLHVRGRCGHTVLLLHRR